MSSEEFEEHDLFLGPVLRINCPRVDNFLKPVTIQLPVSLRCEKRRIPTIPQCRVRVLFLNSNDEHKEWTEITRDLQDPAHFDGTFIRFEVDRFSRYGY